MRFIRQRTVKQRWQIKYTVSRSQDGDTDNETRKRPTSFKDKGRAIATFPCQFRSLADSYIRRYIVNGLGLSLFISFFSHFF